MSAVVAVEPVGGEGYWGGPLVLLFSRDKEVSGSVTTLERKEYDKKE